MTEMFHTPGEDEKKKIEGLGITREDYTKAINECIFGEEEPASKDLEEEIKKMQRHYKTIEEYDGQYAPLYASDIEHIARHFAGWQKVKDQFQIDMAHDGGYMEGQDYAREQMMTPEEKARAYDEALAKAKEQYNYPCMRSCMGILEEIFPELKESEDEKIRKTIISGMTALKDP